MNKPENVKTEKLFNHDKHLDRLRGIAIVLVMACHFFAHSDKSGSGFNLVILNYDLKQILLPLGGVGVGIFFQLSAYLLTLNILEGKYPRLSNYFIKRFRRIYPAFLTFSIMYILFYKFSGKYDYASDISSFKYLITSILFLQPLLIFSQFNAVDVLPGTWSLYPEIYFYIFLPLIVMLLAKRFLRINLLTLIILLTLLFRFNFMNESNWAIRSSLLYYFDFFCVGTIIAYLKFEGKFEYLRFIKPVFGWFFIILSITGKLPTIDSYLLMNIGAGVLMVAAVSKKEQTKNEYWVLSKLAKYSYGLFLSHIFIFWYISVPLLNHMNINNSYHRFLIGSVIALATSLSLSWISYNTIEKYFQKCTKTKLFLGSLTLLIACLVTGFLV
jgi:peptidoglycan/LPS O-acetylase OafA/YrhL